MEEAIGKEERPTLRLLNLASLSLDWKVVASLATMAPNLTHLDESMCVSGVNDRSIQVSDQVKNRRKCRLPVYQTNVLYDARNTQGYDDRKELRKNCFSGLV